LLDSFHLSDTDSTANLPMVQLSELQMATEKLMVMALELQMVKLLA
jgi:hypothetical protein